MIAITRNGELDLGVRNAGLLLMFSSLFYFFSYFSFFHRFFYL